MAVRLYVGNLPFTFDWKQVKDLFRYHGVQGVKRAEVAEDPKTKKSRGWALVDLETSVDADEAIRRLNQLEVDGRQINVWEDRNDGSTGRGGKGDGKASGKNTKGGDFGKGKADFGKNGDGVYDAFTRNRGSVHPTPSFDDRPRPTRGPGRQAPAGPPSTVVPPVDVRQPPMQDASSPAEGDARVYVGNLPFTCTWQRLKDMCKGLGVAVRHVDLATDPSTKASKGYAHVVLNSWDDVPYAVQELHNIEIDGRRIHAKEHVDSRSKSMANQKGGPRGNDSGKGKGIGQGKGGGQEGPQQQSSSKRPRAEPEQEPAEVRRLFAENLAPSVKWRTLKELFTGYFEVDFADVVKPEDDGDMCGVIEFKTRMDALEACMQFNGVLLEGKSVRLRQDRGEFKELRDHSQKQKQGNKRARVAELDHSLDDEFELDAIGAPDELQDDPAEDGVEDVATVPKPSKGLVTRSSASGGKGKGKGLGDGPRVFVRNLNFDVTPQELGEHMAQAGEVRFCDVLKKADGRSKGCALVEYGDLEEAQFAIETLSGSLLLDRAITVHHNHDRG